MTVDLSMAITSSCQMYRRSLLFFISVSAYRHPQLTRMPTSRVYEAVLLSLGRVVTSNSEIRRV